MEAYRGTPTFLQYFVYLCVKAYVKIIENQANLSNRLNPLKMWYKKWIHLGIHECTFISSILHSFILIFVYALVCLGTPGCTERR